MENRPYFPLFIDLSQKRVLVVGAGRIARRRIETLSQFTPHITVVARDVHPDIADWETAKGLRIRRKCYETEDLKGADIVLAATDDAAVNERIWRDCRRLGIPVNVSGDKTKCDFFFPGVARRGSLVAGITASGADHAAAKRLTRAVRELLAQWNT